MKKQANPPPPSGKSPPAPPWPPSNKCGHKELQFVWASFTSFGHYSEDYTCADCDMGVIKHEV